jgi:SAM-dependent methyltransferase
MSVATLQSPAAYVAAITANAADRGCRSDFQQLALARTAPGSTLFDFGSGPGLDARCYAEHGRRVIAYDTDPRMNDYLAGHCADLIESGAVTVEHGSYRQFLAGAAPAAPVALVVANFAPLSLVTDLTALFERFATLTGGGGEVLASVLCPYFAGDLRYVWWWRNAWRLARHGRYAVEGAQGPVWRRTVRCYARACAPHFRLAAVLCGGKAVAGAAAWRDLTRSRYLFLLFRKQGMADAGAAFSDAR